MGDNVIELLSHTPIKHIHILQNRYTPNDIKFKSVSYNTWKLARKNNPEFRVHLQLESQKEKDLIWQQGAPVSTVLYDTPYVMVCFHKMVFKPINVENLKYSFVID